MRWRGLLVVLLLALASPGVKAASYENLPQQPWSFEGPMGRYDSQALQRGLKVYQEVCAACHGLEQLRYGHLTEAGGPELSKAAAKALAASYSVPTLNEDGDTIDRPALLRDYFVEPYANAKQARASNNGALPPDLSLMVKARMGGANYLYALLTGYDKAPDGMVLADGQYYNRVKSPIAMLPPLSDDIVTYEDGTAQTVHQYASDVTQFLSWTADPKMELRKKIGFMVMIYMIIIVGVLYAVMRRVWANTSH